MATMLNPNAIPNGSITLDKIDAAVLARKADKATTLAGYGIGDAYTKSEVDAAIASAITTTLNTEV